MNIIARTYEGKTVTRPDTTWKRGDDASFLPEFVDRVSWTPVVFARICKAGRSVSEKFADRYFDGIGFGVLLYAENLIDGSTEGFCEASCLDHSSFLCWPVYDKITLGVEDNLFELFKDGEPLFSCKSPDASLIRNTIARVTGFCYIRSGDFVVQELATRQPLIAGRDTSCHVSGTFCGNYAIDFKVVL